MHVFLDIRTFGLTPLSNKYPDINPLWDVITIPGSAKGFMHIACSMVQCAIRRP